MTICIAGVCEFAGKRGIIMCADYQGTRGDYIKAEDIYKLWHFHGGKGIIGFAGDIASGKEFVRRLTVATRAFGEIEKTPGDGDLDLRIGEYLAIVRKVARDFKADRADHHVSVRYGIALNDFYSSGAHERFPSHRYDEIFNAIKAVNLGAEFLIAYVGDEEPILIRVDEEGYVSIEDGYYVAIGSGEPLAMAVLYQIDGDDAKPAADCLTWLYQAKLASERNPYVGGATTFWAIFPEGAITDGEEFLVSTAAWNALQQNVPENMLAKPIKALHQMGANLFAIYKPDYIAK
jgi:ATP-dependent protease HslVU (ClpYQ) peptidase subunit